MLTPFLRRNEFLYPVREKDNPDFIVVLYSRKSQRCSYFRHHILFHLLHRTEFQTTGNIHQQHNGQLALFFEHLHVWADVTCGHVPVNITDIVSVLILAHFAERHTAPFERRMVLPSKNIA